MSIDYSACVIMCSLVCEVLKCFGSRRPTALLYIHVTILIEELFMSIPSLCLNSLYDYLIQMIVSS